MKNRFFSFISFHFDTLRQAQWIQLSVMLCLVSIVLCPSSLHSQTIPPPYINYQAVLYDVNNPTPNAVFSNQSFQTFVNISDELGNLLYREEHFASTDGNGLITVKMGDGLYVAGPITNFNQIDWGTGKYYLVVDFNINGTTSSTAPEQLVTVPYSFYSGKAGNGMTAVADNGNGTLTFTYANGQTYITPTLTGMQGPVGPAGPAGLQGPSGQDGIGITSAIPNNNGTITFTYSNGTTSTVDLSSGQQGSIGNGFAGNQSLNALLAGGSATVKKIKIDKFDNLNLLGYLTNSVTFYDTLVNGGAGSAFLMQISNDNTLNWIKLLGSPTTSSKYDLALDTLGNLFCAFGSKLNCYANNSNLIWSKNVNPVVGCDVDANQNVILFNSGGLTKYSNAGVQLWNYSSSYSGGEDLCLDLNGNPVIVYNFTCGGCSGFTGVQKFSGLNGSVSWTSSTTGCAGGSCTGPPLYGGSLCTGKSICTDLNNDVYVIASNAGGTGLFSMQIQGVGGNYLKLSSATGSVSVFSGYGIAPISTILRKNGTNEIYTLANNTSGTEVSIVRLNPLSNYVFDANQSINSMATDFDSQGRFYIALRLNSSQLLSNTSSNQLVPAIPGNSNISIFVFNP